MTAGLIRAAINDNDAIKVTVEVLAVVVVVVVVIVAVVTVGPAISTWAVIIIMDVFKQTVCLPYLGHAVFREQETPVYDSQQLHCARKV